MQVNSYGQKTSCQSHLSGRFNLGPPSRWERFADKTFFTFTWLCTLGSILLLFFILYEIGKEALPAMGKYGLSFLTTTTWDANKAQFGILPHIWGTLYSSFLALFIGGIFGITIAIFLTQDFMPPWLQAIFKNIIELLAAIPSVVYGLWGIFVLIPLIRPYCDWIYASIQLDSIFQHHAGRSGHAAGRSGAGHYDPADGGGRLARLAAGHPL